MTTTTKLLTYDEQLVSPLRNIPQGRKLESWEEVDDVENDGQYPNTDHIKPADWGSLKHVYQRSVNDFVNPFSAHSQPHDIMLFFLHMLDGKVYLINSEGFGYCRYACLVPIPACPFNDDPDDVLDEKLMMFMDQVSAHGNPHEVLRAALNHMTPDQLNSFLHQWR
jgi:hypothetical protein